jgi:hypothetical protein
MWHHRCVLTSQVCTYESIHSPQLMRWSARLRPMWDPEGTETRDVFDHRKMWEWLFICEALREAGVLQPGRRGLGFGVGREALVSLFAGMGCHLVATDLGAEQARAAGWTDTEQYAGGLAGLNEYGFCPPEEFQERVVYRELDMNAIPGDLRDFDFTWSSCAFEHLGSLAAGMDFVVAQMQCLKPGGIAVHTTELNVSSETDTITEGGTVLYRRGDIEDLVRRLRADGHRIAYDLSEGTRTEDRHVDVPPFSNTHLRTKLGEYVTTSIALVIQKGGGPRSWRSRARRVLARRR